MIYQIIYYIDSSSNEYTESVDADSAFDAEMIVLSRLKREYNHDRVIILDIWERGEALT